MLVLHNYDNSVENYPSSKYVLGLKTPLFLQLRKGRQIYLNTVGLVISGEQDVDQN